jgi:TRAP-type C4-dicarboxylate transport system substrate-binding protein
VHQGQAIQMVDKAVHSPDDLKGLKMRIPSRTGAWVIEALGASPVGMPVPALPQALSTKVVDGALIPWEIVPPFKLQELMKYFIEGPNMTRFGDTTFQVSMNQARWNSLPSDIKKAFNVNSGAAWVREVGKIWQEDDEHALKVIEKAGDTHIVLTQAQLAVFKKKLEPVVKRWEDEVKSKGIDGVTLVKVARREIAKYSK